MSKTSPKINLKRGDLIENGWAGLGNPHRITMYISTGEHINSLAATGEIVHHIKTSHRMRVVGHIDYAGAIKTAMNVGSIEDE